MQTDLVYKDMGNKDLFLVRVPEVPGLYMYCLGHLLLSAMYSYLHKIPKTWTFLPKLQHKLPINWTFLPKHLSFPNFQIPGS